MTVAVISQSTETMLLAEFVASLRFEDIPDGVVAKTRDHVRDAIAGEIAASSVEDVAGPMVALLDEFGGAEQATIVGYGSKVPVPHAAMANAMLGHGMELDDAHRGALTKCGATIVPAVMAVAENLGSSGREAVAATVAGYDVMIRIGVAVNPSHRQRGFHSTGTMSAFGTAAAAGKLMGLDAVQMADALGLAGMQAAGLQAFLDDPCMAKPLNAGKGAFNGVLAALLAARGFTGPHRILEGREGFFNAYADEVDTSQLAEGLGTDFKIAEVAFKPHAACRWAHSAIDAMQALLHEHSLSAERIERIVVRSCELASRQSYDVDPTSLNAALSSTPYAIAVAITEGTNQLADYRRAFSDPSTAKLARSVEMVVDPDCGVTGRAATVEVDLRGGGTLSHQVAEPKGEPEVPMSANELETKYYSLVTPLLPRERAEQLADLIGSLDQLDNAGIIPPLTVTEKSG